jgi:outer membrane protein assembly factor BamA
MKIGRTPIFLFFVFILWVPLSAQTVYPIVHQYQDDTLFISQEDTSQLFIFALDSSRINAYADSLVIKLRTKGFLSASVDSLYSQDSTYFIQLYIGKKYKLSDLLINKEDQALLEASGIGAINWSNKIITPSFMNSVKRKALTSLANSGYPFASVQIDSIHVQNNELTGRLSIDKNTLIRYDSIEILGNAKVNNIYLQKLLKVENGEIFNQNNISKIPQIIQSSDFLTLREEPFVTFLNDEASVILPIDKKKASKFDFIIGILPRTENGLRNYTITGDITGQFTNELGDGETFGIRYQRLRAETQDLELSVNYPYLFGFPFGIDGQFSLFRNTDNFLNLFANMGVEYQLSSREKIKFGWAYESSRLIEVDSTSLLAKQTLPEQLDVNVTTGIISINIDRLNYRFNPSKGWNIQVGLRAGQKKIKPNSTIKSLSQANFSFENAYDTLQLSTFQTEIKFSGSIYFPFSSWGTFKLANQSAFKYNQSRIYENEYYRIGGNKLLRGFNEQSIFSPKYTIFSAEFRILLDQLSYISFPFVDYSYYQTTTLDNSLIWDTAFGIGIGLNFGTPAGIFNISFASGSRLNSGLNFGETKIHFGYVNLF